MIAGVERIAFHIHGDDRGSLIAIESNADVPFSICRVYYIFNTCPTAVRGKHAHKDLKQVLVCVHGSCDILLDNGYEQQTVHLSEQDAGVYIYGYIWREMLNFSDDCVLLTLVNRPYSKADYVFDYDYFCATARNHAVE